MFCSLIDSKKSKEILGRAVDNFAQSSDWNSYTLVNTAKFFSSLLLGPESEIAEHRPKLLQLYSAMSDEIPKIVPTVNVNVSVFAFRICRE